MSIIKPLPPETPRLLRIILQIPVLGWMARDVLYGDKDNSLAFALIVVFVWLASVAQWGLAALLIPFTLVIPAAFYGGFVLMVARYEKKAAKAAKS